MNTYQLTVPDGYNHCVSITPPIVQSSSTRSVTEAPYGGGEVGGENSFADLHRLVRVGVISPNRCYWYRVPDFAPPDMVGHSLG